MTSQEKLIAIAAALLRRTVNGEITWKETASETTFLTSVGDTTVSVYVATDIYPSVGIRVINSNGRVVEELTLMASDTPAKPLVNLYNLARRQALNIDATLDDLLKTLLP